MASEAIPIEVGRPCPMPCAECPDRRHHWIPEFVTIEEARAWGPSLVAHVESWPWPGEPAAILLCKHCDAWRPVPEDWEG